MAHGHGGGGASGCFHEDEILGKAYDARLTRRLLTYLRPYRVWVVADLVLLLLLSATQIAPPILAKFVIDSAVAPTVAGELTPEEGLTRLGLAFYSKPIFLFTSCIVFLAIIWAFLAPSAKIFSTSRGFFSNFFLVS